MPNRKEARVFSQDFRLRAVRRMLAGESPSAMARELGVLRKTLYEWKDTYAKTGEAGLARQRGWSPPLIVVDRPPEAAEPYDRARGELLRARARIAELERKVGKQELELDFFGAALQRIRELSAKSKEKNSVNLSPTGPRKAD